MHLAWEFAGRIAHATGIADLGLRVGERTRLGALGAYGRALSRLPTLYETVETACWLSPVHSSGERIWLTWHGEQARLCHAFTHDIANGRSQAEQFTLMILVNLLRSAGGSGWRPERIELTSVAPPTLRRMALFSSAHVSCGHEHTAVTFPRSLLRMPPNVEPRGPAASVQDYGALAASAPAIDFPGSIRQLIGSYLREGYPDVQRIAGIAGLSERTFQRRLMESGATYYGLVDQVRLERARRYLLDPNMKLIDVALELGFSEAASFTRAFRRWTGLSPSAFRRLGPVPVSALARGMTPGHTRERSAPIRRPTATV